MHCSNRWIWIKLQWAAKVASRKSLNSARSMHTDQQLAELTWSHRTPVILTNAVRSTSCRRASCDSTLRMRVKKNRHTWSFSDYRIHSRAKIARARLLCVLYISKGSAGHYSNDAGGHDILPVVWFTIHVLTAHVMAATWLFRQGTTHIHIAGRLLHI